MVTIGLTIGICIVIGFWIRHWRTAKRLRREGFFPKDGRWHHWDGRSGEITSTGKFKEGTK